MGRNHMTNDKILELARRHECFLYGERHWAFTESELIAFAQSVLEEEREQSSYMTLRTQNTPEVMRIDKDGMVYMGRRITDAGEAYEAWLKTMALMQGEGE